MDARLTGGVGRVTFGVGARAGDAGGWATGRGVGFLGTVAAVFEGAELRIRFSNCWRASAALRAASIERCDAADVLGISGRFVGMLGRGTGWIAGFVVDRRRRMSSIDERLGTDGRAGGFGDTLLGVETRLGDVAARDDGRGADGRGADGRGDVRAEDVELRTRSRILETLGELGDRGVDERSLLDEGAGGRAVRIAETFGGVGFVRETAALRLGAEREVARWVAVDLDF